MPESQLITIREARVVDAPAMGRCMVETWLAAHRSHVPQAAWERRRLTWTPEVSATGWQRQLLERDAAPQPQRACYLVAEDAAGDIVGLAAGAAVGDTGSARLGEIWVLYVSEARQRQGVGRRLVRRVAAHLHGQGVTRLQIAVPQANHDASRFYEALGGHWSDSRLLDEDGDLLPERIYSWPDITTLLDAPHG